MSRGMACSRIGGACLALAVAVGLTPSCDDGCDEGTTNVCDEEGDDCFCATDCSAHAECASGEYCLSIGVCVGVYRDWAAEHGCGDVDQDCCMLTPDDETDHVAVCLRGLRCDTTDQTCKP